ncbi:ADP-ribosylglycohydrolase [Purpureocillium lilacinum]|uniref:ADP-ribosylglycohydrolase n=1 Tax=Purpureocillium lilacinum TaxID=33203 RepID=A0A179FVY9_PURLI|nr:ADP-ribosylglycohydrolase [Purpureocillium lilacinum]
MAPSIVRDLELPSHPIPESLQTPSAATPVPALFSLAGKTIAITGGGRGLGLTMALAVVEAGGSVACLDVLPSPGPDWARLEKTASTNKASASYRICDVIDDAALGASIDEIAAEAGARGEPLWGCIACAGIQQQTPALQYPAADFDRMMRVNVTGVFNTCRHTARILQEARRPGSIVMIASISGNIANRGLTCTAYNSSKAAVQQMCRSLAQEWGEYGIRVNTISPGYIRTAMTDQLLAENPKVKDKWMAVDDAAIIRFHDISQNVMDKLQLSQGGLHRLAKVGLHDSIVGCIVGSALGDAVGLYTEFLSGELSAAAYPDRKFVLSPASQATPFRRDTHRGPHRPGEWTDDTDHAMLLLLSCLHTDLKTLDPKDLAARLHTWVQFGFLPLDTLPLGLGRTVGAIVRTKTYLDDPEATARRHWVNAKYNAAPNGSLMRTHPLGLVCLDKSVEETFEVAAAFSAVTHVDPRCVVACAIGTALVRGLVLQEVRSEADIDSMVETAINWYARHRARALQDDPERRDEPDLDATELRRHAKVEHLKDLELDDSYKIGYVYKTFGSGLHLLRLAMRSTSTGTVTSSASAFEPLITDLIMLGGDADTNACFAGALLGAYLGYVNLPVNWREGLRHGAWLMGKAEGLCRMLGVADGEYVGSADKETARDGGRGGMPSEADMERKVMVLQAWMAEQEQEAKRRASKAEDKKWFKWKN